MKKLLSVLTALALSLALLAPPQALAGNAGSPFFGGGAGLVGGGAAPTVAYCTANPVTCGAALGYSNPLWYGATGADNHDDSAGIDAAATAACSGGWKRVGFTFGTYLVLHQHDAKCSGEVFFALPQNSAYDASNQHDAVTIHINNGFVAGWISTNNCYYNQNGTVDSFISYINFKADGGSLGTAGECNSHNTAGADQVPRIYNDHVGFGLLGAGIGSSITTSGITGLVTPFAGTGTTKNNLVTARCYQCEFSENAVGVTANVTDFMADDNTEFAGNACGAIVGVINGTQIVRINAFRIEENGSSGISGVCGAHPPAVEVTGPGWSLTGVQFQGNNGPALLFDNSYSNFSMTGGLLSSDGQAAVANAQSEIVFNTSSGSHPDVSFNGVSVYPWSGGNIPNYFADYEGTADSAYSFSGGNIGASAYNTSRDLFGTETVIPSIRNVAGETDSVVGDSFIKGSTSGVITKHPQAAAGTYNWNWPITAGSAGQALTSQAGGSTAMTWSNVISPSAIYNYIGGLTLSNDGGTPNTVIDVAAGSASSDDATAFMQLGSAYTKTTGAWAVGTGNGCLDTGAVANSTWYHVFLIQRVDTGVVDLLCSTSATSPTYPANYTVKRRVGSFKTNGSANILAFTQRGSVFLWGTAVLDMSSVGITTTASLNTLASVPTGIVVQPLCRLTMSDAGHSILVTSPDEGDQLPTDTTPFSAAPGFDRLDVNLTNGDANANCPFTLTNTSGQLRMRCSSGTCTTSVVTRGWVD